MAALEESLSAAVAKSNGAPKARAKAGAKKRKRAKSHGKP
jgi:hypothetical protein